MAKNEDPDNIQGDVVKGKRGTQVKIDFPRDNSSLELPRVHGKELQGKGDLSHSLKGTSIASEA